MSGKSHAVVFDWNGTLLADTQCCLRATNAVLKRLGRRTVTLEQYRQYAIVPIAHMYHAFGCDAEELTRRAVEIHDLWNGVYNAGARKARLRRGARGVLDALRELQQRVLILSNHTVANISGHTRRLGVHACFDAILANDKVGGAFTKRGKGERLPTYLKENGIKSGIIIGDSEEEVEIARAHDFVSVAITGGVCSTRRLAAAKPDYMIRNLNEIPVIAERVFARRRGVR